MHTRAPTGAGAPPPSSRTSACRVGRASRARRLTTMASSRSARGAGAGAGENDCAIIATAWQEERVRRLQEALAAAIEAAAGVAAAAGPGGGDIASRRGAAA